MLYRIYARLVWVSLVVFFICLGSLSALLGCGGEVGFELANYLGVWICIGEREVLGCEFYVIFTFGFIWYSFKLLSSWKDFIMKLYFICFFIWL